MKAPSPFLYIGVESGAREFDARLLLAASAAERGFIVVLGQHVFLNRAIGGLVPGTFLVKGLNRVQVDALRHAGGRHLIAAIDEEALGIADADYMAKDIDPAARDFCHLVFAQGEVQRDMLRTARGFADDAVVVTGNPRLDLLRQPLTDALATEVEALRHRFGRFVLVNTNCCAVHPAFGTTDDYFRVCVDIGWLDPDNEAEVALWREHVRHDRMNDAALSEAVRALPGALPSHAVVVRPHPSEDVGAWHARFDGMVGVHVLREGPHVPWMMAADAVLHASCTSGVEAAVLGRPVVSLVPTGAPVAHWYLSNALNPNADTPGGAVEMIRRMVISGIEESIDIGSDIRRHLASVDGAFAVDRVTTALEARVVDPRFLDGRVMWSTTELSETPRRSGHAREKFSMTIQGVTSRLEGMAGLLGRFGDIVVEEAWESLFVLSRRGRLMLPPDGRLFRSPD